jgi:hypothetical protein
VITPNDYHAVAELLFVIARAHRQHADDLCWMDIDLIFAAAGLPVPDRKVGDKVAMLDNCRRYVHTMCAGGGWKTYEELEKEITRLQELARKQDDLLKRFADRIGQQSDILTSLAMKKETKQ